MFLKEIGAIALAKEAAAITFALFLNLKGSASVSVTTSVSDVITV